MPEGILLISVFITVHVQDGVGTRPGLLGAEWGGNTQ